MVADRTAKALVGRVCATLAALLPALTALGAGSAPPAPAAYQLELNAEAFAYHPASRAAPVAPRRFEEPAGFPRVPYAGEIVRAAESASLDPLLVHAVIYVESRYDWRARSLKGAIGLMQVLPSTALRYGVDDPARSVEANLRAGTRYLRDLIIMFGGQVDLALAAYNAGEAAVRRYGDRIPPFPETQRYVPAVLARYREWQPAVRPEDPPDRVTRYAPGTRLGNLGSRFVMRPGAPAAACASRTPQCD